MTQYNCPSVFDDPFKCPTKEEYLVQLLSMLPRGRAWQSHEAATSAIIERFPDEPSECGIAECGTAECGQISVMVSRTVLAAYWAAFAGVNEYFAQRACQLLDEFFCETIKETFEVWADDYGFPDPCYPWDDLCEKVAARGGQSCGYIVWAASLRGWDIDCFDCSDVRAHPLTGCSLAGEYTVPCYDCEPNTIRITINVNDSPAFTVVPSYAYAGHGFAGCTVLCDPDPQAIECLIERIKPAHTLAVYAYSYGPALRTIGLTVGSPIFEAPVIGDIMPVDLEVGELDIGTPTLALVPRAATFEVGSPRIGMPVLHDLLPVSLSVGSPVLGTPTLT